MELAFQPKGAYGTLNALEICCLLIQQFLKVIKIPLSLFPLVPVTECMYLTLFTAFIGRIWTPIFYLFIVLCSTREVGFRKDLGYTLILLIDLKTLMVQTTHEESVFSGIIQNDDSRQDRNIMALTLRWFPLGRVELDFVLKWLDLIWSISCPFSAVL